MTDWVVPGSIRVQLHTSTPMDQPAQSAAGYASTPWYEWSTDAPTPLGPMQAAVAIAEGLQDALAAVGGTVYYDRTPLREAPLTVCYEPWLAAALWGNAYIVDEVTIATAARRERLRSIHMAYGRRLRSRRRRGHR